ncbi:hypothetical protein TNCV_1425051 [Trichonephila clavipes]|nr:hypothetical protein TNCV_1425051 [Trichonephila clavipes]
MQSQKNIDFITNDDPSIYQKVCAAFYSRRQSVSGKSLTSFPEDTSLPYSGFQPEPSGLQVEDHNHHTGRAASSSIEIKY